MNYWAIYGHMVGGKAKLMTSDECQPVEPSSQLNALDEKPLFHSK